MNARGLDRKTLHGNDLLQFLQELITNSGVFWMFDMIRQSSRYTMQVYFASVPHWILLGSSILQAFVIHRTSQRRYWWHYFIAPTVYTVIDVMLEGVNGFVREPYHILYWMWAGAMAVTYLLPTTIHWSAIVLKALLFVLLLPANYMISEWETASSNLIGYWVNDSAHLFILLGALMLGVLLGVANLMREHFVVRRFFWKELDRR